MSPKVKDILEWVYCIVIAIVLALLFRYYIGTPTIVKQVSMNPTLVQNQRLWLNRWGRTTKKLPERGNIITFEAPSKKSYTLSEIDQSNPVAKYEYEPKSILGKFTYYVLEIGKDSYIKRVIALPGEHVQIKDGKVYINGKYANIIGNVCMDNFMVDVTNIENIKIGDEVILWDNENITVEEVAKECDTINYEILCNISKRIPRKYV